MNGAGDNDDMGGEFGMDISDLESDEQPGLKPQPEQPDSEWFDGEQSKLDGEQPGLDGEPSESDGEQFDGERSREDSDDK